MSRDTPRRREECAEAVLYRALTGLRGVAARSDADWLYICAKKMHRQGKVEVLCARA